MASGRHPRAVGTYGPAVAQWALERPRMHPLRDGHGLRELRWWQAYALARAFEHDDAGHLVWRTVLVSGPRQVGKSWLERVVCAWRIHAGAVFGGPQDVLHVAHKLQAAQEVWRPAARWAVGAYGKGCVRWANGEQQIELPDDGSRWLIQAATDGAGVAFSLSMALVDEAWMVARHVVDAAIAPTMIEAENPQLWLVSTAGTSQSDLMATYRAHALALDPPADDTSLLILEWSAPPDPDIDIDDPAVWRAASPHWSPKREAVIRDERGKVPEVDFRQQWLNQWVPTVSAPLIDSERWAASAWHGALPGGPLVFGVDIAPDREYAAIVTYVGGVVEVVDARPGNTAWVPGRLVELCARWSPRAVGIDGSGPAATVADQLHAAPEPVPLVVLTARQLAAACGQVFDSLAEGRILAVPHEQLTASVLAARRRSYGQSWIFARQSGDTSGVPLLALTVAAWAYEHAPDVVEKSKIW